MSTRCNIIIENNSIVPRVWLYRHMDGYPECTGSKLKNFMKKVKSTNNKEVAYELLREGEEEYADNKYRTGAYEITDGMHGDIEYLYTLNLVDKTVHTEKISHE